MQLEIENNDLKEHLERNGYYVPSGSTTPDSNSLDNTEKQEPKHIDNANSNHDDSDVGVVAPLLNENDLESDNEIHVEFRDHIVFNSHNLESKTNLQDTTFTSNSINLETSNKIGAPTETRIFHSNGLEDTNEDKVEVPTFNFISQDDSSLSILKDLCDRSSYDYL